MPRQRLVLDEGGPCVQCKCCHFWNNLRDIGHKRPGICLYCDELLEERMAMEELRVELEGQAVPDKELLEAFETISKSITVVVAAMRAGTI